MKRFLAPKNFERNRWLPWLIITVVVVIWLAPITLLGKMPIGGDVTSFFLPLMAYYRQALLDGRVPLWNELWGFGFPMLAESQAGVFYPPHLVLFSRFETETAYSLNIVLHHLLSGWFAYLCGRAFGLRRWGATLTGLVFAGNGFFIIHFPHQWAYTSGAWLPLAVALAWRAAGGARMEDRGWKIEGRGLTNDNEGRGIERGSVVESAFKWRSRTKASLGLAAVLAVQMSAGHFQIAFYTQVVVLLIGLLCTLQRVFGRLRTRRVSQDKSASAQDLAPSTPYSALGAEQRGATPSPRQRSGRRYARPIQSWGSPAALLWLGIPLAIAFVLAAVQLLPTYELIRIALPEGRDFEYLSGFANTPLHLVSYLLPTLFHVNPLWRPVAWDPFHTSPEECFSYVGLLPICLAAGAAWRWRREPRVRLWVLLVVITLLLSLGPYVPGFKWLIMLPGFDGFRSASRWSVVTALFCGLLAGRGLDGVRSGARLRLWMRGLLVVFLIVAGAGAAFLHSLLDNSRPAATGWVGLAERVRRVVSPWPNEPSVAEIAERAEDTPRDPAVYDALARVGFRIRMDPMEGDTAQSIFIGSTTEIVREVSLSDQRRFVLWSELAPPVIAMFLTAIVVFVCHRSRETRPGILLAITVFDLGAAAWLRPIDFASRGNLVAQSPVLGYLRSEFSGQRGLDSMQNLAMTAGAAPVRSYRTVDIAFLESVNPIWLDPRYPKEQRDRVIGRGDVRWFLQAGSSDGWRNVLHIQADDTHVDFSDSTLGRITHGPGLSGTFPKSTAQFVVRQPKVLEQSRAWFVAAGPGEEESSLVSKQAGFGRRAFDSNYFTISAAPVDLVRSAPESAEFAVRTAVPGIVLFSELSYPGWEAILTSDDVNISVEVLTTLPGCRAVRIPGPGEFRLTLRYRPITFEKGRWISLIAWGVLAIGLLLTMVKLGGRLAAANRETVRGG
jgi:hypothetical protein